jgi:hypothetical protein
MPGGTRPGAGRKTHSDGPLKLIAVYLLESLVTSLGDLAERKGWSRSKAVAAAIKGQLAKNGLRKKTSR